MYVRIIVKWYYASKYNARIMRAWVTLCATLIMRGPNLLCATLCAAPATLQYIMRGLCAPGVLLCAALCATLCADSSHYARNAYSALCPPWPSTPPALRLSNNPSFVHTHHGTAEPANATNISCHSQVEARIISRIISAHNNYSR